MSKKLDKLIYWLPRILSVLLTAFLVLFSFDVFGEGLSVWEVILAFLMHNIPVFILTAVIIVSWKHEWVGGIVFILAGLLYIVQTFFRAGIPWYLALSWSMILAVPAIVIGVLYLLNWKNRMKI